MKFLDVEVNLVWFILSFFAFYMLIFTFLINILTPFTPKLLSDLFGYGESFSNLVTLEEKLPYFSNQFTI